MSTECLPLHAFSDNYIWVIRHGQDVIVVDPGDAGVVENFLLQEQCCLQGILLTHHHHDHVDGVPELMARHPAIPVYGPATITHVTHPVADGDTVHFKAPRLALRVLSVPGHTLDHLAYVTLAPGADAPWLFCGDTLFSCGCGRLFEGTPETMLASLDKLAALPGATRLYCTHEYTQANIRFALACDPENRALLQWRDEVESLRQKGQITLPTTLAHEHQVNPYLRVDDPSIQARLMSERRVDIPDRLAAFTVMRQWKDQFS